MAIMVTSKMSKIITIFFSLNIFILVHSHVSANDFNSWLLNFKNYAIKSGVSKSRIEAKGYGEEKPIASNKTELGRKKNRRVELKIIGK